MQGLHYVHSQICMVKITNRFGLCKNALPMVLTFKAEILSTHWVHL